MFNYRGISIDASEILVYLRKSRTDDPLLTVEEVLERHEKILKEWCERNIGGWVPAANIFREIVSGETIAARPDFQQILRLIEGDKYKAILTVDAQRLSRGDLEDAGRLIKLLRYTNTFVITPDMAFNLGEEYDRERFKRELERGNDYLEYYKKISWRGRVESVKAGWYIGSIAPYGYDKCKVMDGKRERPTLKINEREAEVVRLIFDWYVNEDMGMTNIAHRLNAMGYPTRGGLLWSTATIKCMLMNVHYNGKIIWERYKTINVVSDGEIEKIRPTNKDHYIFDGKHPAIIDDELFERARAKQGRNARLKLNKPLRNPLAGLLFCKCGHAMTYRTHNRPDGTERCSPRLLCNNQAYCHSGSVTFDEMIVKVMDVLRECIADFEIKLKNDKKNTQTNKEERIKKLEAKLDELNRKELNQWEKYSEEGMPKAIFDKLNEKVLRDKEMVLAALEIERAATPTADHYQEKIMRFTDALNALNDPNASAQDKNRLLKACIDRITYTREKGNRYHKPPIELDVTLRV